MNKLEKEIFEMEEELGVPSHLRWHNSKPKQETLEEAAGRCAIKENRSSLYELGMKYFIEGYKLAQEQEKNKYSVEDLDAFRKFMIQEQNFSKSCLDVFVEQLKKK